MFLVTITFLFYALVLCDNNPLDPDPDLDPSNIIAIITRLFYVFIMNR